MTLSLATVEALAPDQASLKAAKKLVQRAKWPVLEDDGAFAWGLCQGSGSNPYRVMLDLGDHGNKCTCPSRKFPCKHVLALAWIRAEDPDAFTDGTRPDWVDEWNGRRRKRGTDAVPDAAAPDVGEGPRKSIAQASRAEPAKALTPEEAARKAERAAQQRARNRAQREALVAGGLDELDAWIDDLLARGAVASAGGLAERAAPIVRRLADAKAPALATRVDSIASRLLELDVQLRPAALVRELGALSLVAASYRRAAELPPALAEDARRDVGWVLDADELLARGEAVRVQGSFEVVQKRDVVQPDGLRRFETWLHLLGADEAPASAVLVDYTPVRSGVAPAGGLALGAEVDGELVYYPSAAPLRARFGQTGPALREPEEPATHFRSDLAGALARHRDRAARLPWLGADALAVDGVRVRRSSLDGRPWLADDHTAVPLADPWKTVGVLEGLSLDGVFGILEDGALRLGRAHAEGLGVWRAEVDA